MEVMIRLGSAQFALYTYDKPGKTHNEHFDPHVKEAYENRERAGGPWKEMMSRGFPIKFAHDCGSCSTERSLILRPEARGLPTTTLTIQTLQV